MRAIRVLITVAGVADGLIDFYSFPIGIKFISDYHRECGTNHRTHLRTMRHDMHAAICVYSYECVRVQRGAIGICCAGRNAMVSQAFRYVVRSQDERPRSYQSLEESAAADIGDRAHTLSSAAALMAARMR